MKIFVPIDGHTYSIDLDEHIVKQETVLKYAYQAPKELIQVLSMLGMGDALIKPAKSFLSEEEIDMLRAAIRKGDEE